MKALGREIKRIVIIPAGGKAREVADQMLRIGINVLCMCDNGLDLQGKKYKHIPVISIEEATKRYAGEFFYLTVNSEAIRATLKEQLMSCGISEERIRTYLYSDYASNLEEVDYPGEIKRIYKAAMGKELDYDHVRTFTEKIQWLRAYEYGRNPIYTKLADKYEVRSWVKSRVGKKYLIPLIGVWDDFDDIDIKKLPNTFVLKCNHGCGFTIIVHQKEKADWIMIKEKIERWMTINYAFAGWLELQYKNIIPKIICEQYLENSNGNLYDYKFHCFNGKPEYVYIVKNRNNKMENTKERNYDMHWNPQEFTYNMNELDESIDDCPDNFNEMVEVATKLCKGFKYVRVDLYRLNNGEIYFGEMTFTPSGGLVRWRPEEMDLIMGDKILL